MNNLAGVLTPPMPTMPSPVGAVPIVQSTQPANVPMLQGNPVYPVQDAPLQSLEVPLEPDLSSRFASLNDVSVEEIAEGKTRVLKGDGTSFLSAPGLKRLEGIRIGNQELPFFEARSYPVDTTGTRHKTINEPLIKLDRRSDGTPVIIRALISNDGRWPAGLKIFVTGEWEEGLAPNHSVSAQRAEKAADAITRRQVYRETGDARIAGVEGNAPVITDPLAAVHGSAVAPGASVLPVTLEPSHAETMIPIETSQAETSESEAASGGKKRGR